MGSAKSFLLVGAITLVTLTGANAADLPPVMPMKAPAVYDYSGWYLRGDIGMTNQQVKTLSNTFNTDTIVIDKSFDAGWLFGLGIGYQVNNWLRFDVTGEYRGKTDFHGYDQWIGYDGANTTTAKKSEWVGLFNAYVDLGTWYGITPFVGAGVGGSNIKISDYADLGIGNPAGIGPIQSLGYGKETSKWNLAWAVHAGLAYRVTPGLTVELAYRYIDLGDAYVSDTCLYNAATCGIKDVTDFKGITSHDVKFGVRWMLGEPEYYAPPLMRKG
jgi:opacity protein-like surface antigen